MAEEWKSANYNAADFGEKLLVDELTAALGQRCEHCDEIIKLGKKINSQEVPPSCRPQLRLLDLLNE